MSIKKTKTTEVVYTICPVLVASHVAVHQGLLEAELKKAGGLRKLEPRLQETFFAQYLLCLRLAVIVCHARGDVEPGEIRLAVNGTQTTIALAPGWAESHPRALHLLREEVDAWTKAGLLHPVLAPA